MARKTTFDWVRDREVPDTPRKDRTTRREKTEPLDRARDLVHLMLEQPKASWARLPLSEQALEMLRHLVAIPSKARGAIRRQTLLLTRALADEDLDALAEALGADGGTSDRDDALDQLVRWRTRIIDEGDPALQGFIELYPQADRQRLRALANRCRSGDEAKKARASKQLMAALRDAAGIA